MFLRTQFDHSTMKLKYFLLLVLIMGALLAAWLMFFYSEGTRRTVYEAVPNEAVIVFESTAGPFWQKLTSETGMIASLSEMDFMRSLHLQLNMLDTLLGKKNKEFYSFMQSQPMLLFLLPANDAYNWVMVAQFSDQLRMYEIPELAGRAFGNRIEVLSRKTHGFSTALLVDKSSGLQLHYTITGGLFVGSFSKDGFEKALKQLGEKSNLLTNSDFATLRETRGGFVDGYVYVNNVMFSKFVQQQIAPEHKDLIAKIAAQLGSWTSLDLSIRNANFVHNGFTQLEKGSFLEELAATQAVEGKCFTVLPFNTRTLFQMAVPDFAAFYKKQFDQDGLNALSHQLGIDIESIFIKNIESEIAIAQIQKAGATDAVFLCRIKDVALLDQQLRLLSKQLNNAKAIPEGMIFNLGINQLVHALFGIPYGSVSGSWVGFADQFLLIASDPSTLELLLKHHQRGRVLMTSEHFRQFSNNLADASNMLIYTNIREGLPVLNSYFGKALSFHINRNQQAIRDFEAMALQLSAAGSMMYTSFIVKHNPDYKEESMTVWKYTLEAQGAQKPYIIYDRRSNSNKIATVDENNTLYLLSSSGQLLWKKQLQDLPLSEIFAVDRGSQDMLLFNTPTHIHLMDMYGRASPGFPVRLRSEATNSLLLVDYDGKKDSRIIVACSDRTIYSYDLTGRIADGWEMPRTADIVTRPIDYFRAAGSDYLVSADVQGDVRAFDRRGQLRISPRGQFTKAVHSPFYLNRTNSRGVLLTTAADGKIVYISGTGQLSSTDFGYFSPEHFFIYEDFNQNRSVDFIWLDGKDLKVFDRFQQLVFQYTFKQLIDNRPYFQQIGSNTYLVVIDDESGEVYLFDKEGKSIIASGLPVQTAYTIGSLFNNDEISVLALVDNQLIHFQVY